jgi:hypothetical protein
MKSLINNFPSYLGVLFLAAVFLGAFGCATSKPTPGPLAGWTFRSFPGWDLNPNNKNHLDKAIIEDYEKFISDQHLDLFGGIAGFYEDGMGRHAVEFQAFPPGENATWNYVLIYDKENKRIRTIRYNHIRYQS